MACRYCSALAAANISTGLAALASAGKMARRAAVVSGASGGTVNPSASHVSAQRMAGPPTFVTIPTRPPVGTGCLATSAAISNRLSMVSARITPACRNKASTVTSDAATSAPVCS
jgi:hypothetical protein